MGNHYHVVVQTHRPNLSRLMRHVNGVYTQTYNRRHGVVGHLFQGCFKAILVEEESYFLEVCRYVDLNPVRPGMVKRPQDWAWSSYRARTGRGEAPAWLDSGARHRRLAPRAPRRATALRRVRGPGARCETLGSSADRPDLSWRRGFCKTHAGARRIARCIRRPANAASNAQSRSTVVP